MTKKIFLILFALVVMFAACSKDENGTTPPPTGPNGNGGGNGSTSDSGSGTWSSAGSQLTLTMDKATGQCTYVDSLSMTIYVDDTVKETDITSYSLQGDTVLVVTFYKSIRDTSTGDTLVARTEAWTFSRLAGSGGLEGTWESKAKPVIDYTVGSEAIDTTNLMAYVTSVSYKLELYGNNTFSAMQNIHYSSAIFAGYLDSLTKKLSLMFPSPTTVTRSGNTITVQDASLPKNLVVTASGNYPDIAVTATYKDESGTLYLMPSNTAECQSEVDDLSLVYGSFYQDLLSAAKAAFRH
jgi:hypothetical protein